jgi:hypothetical protein
MYSLYKNTNEDGSRLVNLAVSKNMFIGITKQFIKSSDGKSENQIDHLHIDDVYQIWRMLGHTEGVNIESDH